MIGENIEKKSKTMEIQEISKTGSSFNEKIQFVPSKKMNSDWWKKTIFLGKKTWCEYMYTVNESLHVKEDLVSLDDDFCAFMCSHIDQKKEWMKDRSVQLYHDKKDKQKRILEFEFKDSFILKLKIALILHQNETYQIESIKNKMVASRELLINKIPFSTFITQWEAKQKILLAINKGNCKIYDYRLSNKCSAVKNIKSSFNTKPEYYIVTGYAEPGYAEHGKTNTWTKKVCFINDAQQTILWWEGNYNCFAFVKDFEPKELFFFLTGEKADALDICQKSSFELKFELKKAFFDNPMIEINSKIYSREIQVAYDQEKNYINLRVWFINQDEWNLKNREIDIEKPYEKLQLDIHFSSANEENVESLPNAKKETLFRYVELELNKYLKLIENGTVESNLNKINQGIHDISPKGGFVKQRTFIFKQETNIGCFPLNKISNNNNEENKNSTQISTTFTQSSIGGSYTLSQIPTIPKKASYENKSDDPNHRKKYLNGAAEAIEDFQEKSSSKSSEEDEKPQSSITTISNQNLGTILQNITQDLQSQAQRLPTQPTQLQPGQAIFPQQQQKNKLTQQYSKKKTKKQKKKWKN